MLLESGSDPFTPSNTQCYSYNKFKIMEVPQSLSGPMSNKPEASNTSAHGGSRRALSQEKKDRITMLLAGGMKVGEVSTLEKVSTRSIHKIRSTLRTWGTHTLEPM